MWTVGIYIKSRYDHCKKLPLEITAQYSNRRLNFIENIENSSSPPKSSAVNGTPNSRLMETIMSADGNKSLRVTSRSFVSLSNYKNHTTIVINFFNKCNESMTSVVIIDFRLTHCNWQLELHGKTAFKSRFGAPLGLSRGLRRTRPQTRNQASFWVERAPHFKLKTR